MSFFEKHRTHKNGTTTGNREHDTHKVLDNSRKNDGGNNSTEPANAKKKSVTERAIEIIKKEEGFTHYAVWDYAQYSYGYGQKANFKSEYISREEADKRLVGEVQRRYEFVKKDFSHLNEEQQATLISFHFNCPAGYNSIVKNGKNLKIHDSWCKTAGGKVLKGLVERRNREKIILSYN